MYVIGIASFNECFLFDVATGRHCFLQKFTLRAFPAAMLLISLKEVLKEVRILRYLPDTITVQC